MMRIFCFWWNIFLRNPIDCKISVMKLFNLIVKCQMSVMTLENGKSDDSDQFALKLAFISVRVKWVPSQIFFGEVGTQSDFFWWSGYPVSDFFGEVGTRYPSDTGEVGTRWVSDSITTMRSKEKVDWRSSCCYFC